MGLDVVEIVLRCEEVFAVDLPDSELADADTVGGLYRLVCFKLKLQPVKSPGPETGIARLPRGLLHLSPVPWNAEDVWATLVAIFVNQMLLEPDEVRYEARIVQDLGID